MPIGVVSTGSPARIDAILNGAGLAEYFHLVIGVSKDKTKGIAEALSALRVAYRSDACTCFVQADSDSCEFGDSCVCGFSNLQETGEGGEYGFDSR
jgi:hypothetical protein